METIDRNKKTSSENPEVDVRLLTADDADDYMALLAKNRERMSDVKHKIDPYALYGTPEGLIEHLEQGEGRHGIWADGQLVGGIDTMPMDRADNQEVSYWLDKESTRRGIGLTALKLLTNRKDQAGISLTGVVEQGNIASWRLLERAGYREAPMNSDHPGQYIFRHTAKRK